jgi:cytochrome c peroxidase
MAAGCVDGGPEIERSVTEVRLNGLQLYDRATFDGNGRTCRTCHDARTGTFSPATAQQLYDARPDAPLFRPVDSDDGVGDSYQRLLTHATVRVPVELPANITLAGAPGQRTIVLHRGVPTTMNTPALDGVLMLDGRAPSLEDQAAGAIGGHAEAGREPSPDELAAIADFEQTHPRFFSSPALRRYAGGGDAPELPAGDTASERRGRLFFVDGGRCAGCHGGPMLNETSRGSRFLGVGVSERNAIGNPVYRFVVDNGDGTETVVESPDPGRMLITGSARDANRFKIPSLWGVSNTAPYFHDNSAKTLEEMVAHYSAFFESRDQPALTAQEQADIVAYLKLL